MCGRFTLAQSPEAVAKAFGLDAVPNFPPRYNIAPSQPVGVIVRGFPQQPTGEVGGEVFGKESAGVVVHRGDCIITCTDLILSYFNV
jgi:hypothetical protein